MTSPPNELFIATKAGYDMWPGPYGNGGSRKYLMASLDQSLKHLGLDYVDVFYSHRPDLDVPLTETVGALVSAVQQGKALYAGISNYRPDRTAEAAQLLARPAGSRTACSTRSRRPAPAVSRSPRWRRAC